MRRNLFARISLAGILIQLAVCMPAVAANVKSSTTTKHRVTGVVKDALGRPIKHATLSIQNAAGRVVTHAASNDAGEFSFSVSRGTYAIVATNPDYLNALWLDDMTRLYARMKEAGCHYHTLLRNK